MHMKTFRLSRPRLRRLEARDLPATYVVTTAADVIDPADGVLSLREAVIAANANPGADIVQVPAGTFTLTLAGAKEDACQTGDLDVTGDLTVQGTGTSTTVLDGN